MMNNLENITEYFKNANVLFLEYSSNNNFNYSTLLQKKFSNLLVSCTISDALVKVQNKNIDLIIIEINGNSTERLELINNLRNKHNIIVLFDQIEVGLLRAILKLQLDGYIDTKSLYEDLDRAIDKLVNNKKNIQFSQNEQNYYTQY